MLLLDNGRFLSGPPIHAQLPHAVAKTFFKNKNALPNISKIFYASGVFNKDLTFYAFRCYFKCGSHFFKWLLRASKEDPPSPPLLSPLPSTVWGGGVLTLFIPQP
jgi:hypothetical protein